MDAKKEFSTRVTLKSTTVAVAVTGVLSMGAPAAPDEPLHAADHQPHIGIPAGFGFGGGTAMDPEAIREPNYVAGSAAPGPGARFKLSTEPFTGI